jgi:hypothetical protein
VCIHGRRGNGCELSRYCRLAPHYTVALLDERGVCQVGTRRWGRLRPDRRTADVETPQVAAEEPQVCTQGKQAVAEIGMTKVLKPMSIE